MTQAGTDIYLRETLSFLDSSFFMKAIWLGCWVTRANYKINFSWNALLTKKP